MSNKKELRKTFLTLRNSLEEEYRLKSGEEIFSKLENMEFFKNSEIIFIYINFGSEIITENFIKKYITKKKILVPKIVLGEMKLVHLKKYNDLVLGNYGILEPKGNEYYNGRVDLVVTPSIVYDKAGYRIGYGGGYYDRFLAENRHKLSVGVCYEKMIQDEVLRESYDKSVDLIITESKIRIINETKYSSDN